MRFTEAFTSPLYQNPRHRHRGHARCPLSRGDAGACRQSAWLIDPATISVGTMGDAKPYAFTTADGNFTGFDIELFLNVAGRLGFKKEQVVFTGQEFSA